MSLQDEIRRELSNKTANFEVGQPIRVQATSGAVAVPATSGALVVCSSSSLPALVSPGDAYWMESVSGDIDGPGAAGAVTLTVAEGGLQFGGFGMTQGLQIAQPTLTALSIRAFSVFNFFMSKKLWTFRDLSLLGVSTSPPLRVGFTILNPDAAPHNVTVNLTAFLRRIHGIQEN